MYYEAGFVFFILMVLSLYLYCTRNDNNHVQAYKRFSIFFLKVTVIAVVLMAILVILMILGVNFPDGRGGRNGGGRDNSFEFGRIGNDSEKAKGGRLNNYNAPVRPTRRRLQAAMGISACTIPFPAVIHCKSPGPITPLCPLKS